MTSLPFDQHVYALANSHLNEEKYISRKQATKQCACSQDQNWKLANHEIRHDIYRNVSNCRNDAQLGKISQLKSTVTNPPDICNTMDTGTDSPGVARARRLLSTMKVHREIASLQLQKSGTTNPGGLKQLTQNKSQMDRTISNHIKDTSYYDTINQELRSRIQHKIDSEQNLTPPSKSLSLQLSSRHGNDNSTVSTAQSTYCKTTASSVSSTLGSSSTSTASGVWSSPMCFPLNDSIDATAVKKKKSNATCEAQKPSSDQLIEELSALLAKCNESTPSKQQQTMKSNDKQQQTNNSIRHRHDPVVILSSSSPAISPKRNRKMSSPIKRRQRSSPMKLREIQCEKSSESPPKSRSEHCRSISFRKVQSFDASRIATSDAVFRRLGSSNKSTRNGRRTTNTLFPSASADDVIYNDDDKITPRYSSSKKKNPATKLSTKIMQKKQQIDHKTHSNDKHISSIAVATILSGASTASMTTSGSSDYSKSSHNNVLPLQSRPLHLSAQKRSELSTSIPRLVHSYHDRSGTTHDVAAISPLSTYRSNSLSPKRRRQIDRPSNNCTTTKKSNRLSRGLSMNDIDTPLLLLPKSPISTSTTGTPIKPCRSSKETLPFMTDMFLTQIQHEAATTHDSLDTPEGRKLFIRNLYCSNSTSVSTNVVDVTPHKNSSTPMEETSSSSYIQLNLKNGTSGNNRITTCPSTTTEKNGVRSIINAFQAINTAIKQDLDVSTRIKKEFQNQRIQQQQKHHDKLDPSTTHEHLRTPSISNSPKVGNDGCVEKEKTKAEAVKQKGILVNRINEMMDDDNETATFDATVDIAYDEDCESECTTSSDTSGWMSNSSNTYTLDYDSDVAARSRKLTRANAVVVNGKAGNKNKEKTQDLKDTAKSSIKTVATTASKSHLTNDNVCADTVSLLSADGIEEGNRLVIAVAEDKTPPLSQKTTHTKESISFSPFEELKWDHSPRKKRVCFVPDSEYRHLDVYYYPPEDTISIEDQYGNYEHILTETIPQRILVATEGESNTNCSTSGGLYDLTVPRRPAAITDDTAESKSINTSRKNTKSTADKLSPDFQCESYESHLDITNRSGRDIECKNKKHLSKGNKSVRSNRGTKAGPHHSGDENDRELLPARGGLYDLALQSGLTKKQMRSREPYKVSVNLKNVAFSNKELNAVVKEKISDQRCGATGGWYYLAKSRTSIPKRKPLEADIYWVD
jgi:hypothetical protein